MRYLIAHINTILATYKGHPPLASWLKNYFKIHPKLGSRDRKALSTAIYSYYRNAAFYPKGTDSFQIIVQNIDPNSFLFKILQATVTAETPGVDSISSPVALSTGMNEQDWLQSLKIFPDLFIRLRHHVERHKKSLQEAGIPFESIALPGAAEALSTCIQLPNSTDVSKLIPEKDYVIQDAASQSSLSWALSLINTSGRASVENVWDVCSGAGGKSIFLKDCLPLFQLLATDKRASVLRNLQKRFALYGLGNYHSYVLDLLAPQSVAQLLADKQFDFVVCDVPCSGSGTWARTPEQFHFFDPNDLQQFEALQFPIVSQSWHYLKPGGFLAYITCSVFHFENEAVAEKIKTLHSAQFIDSLLINGTTQGSDSMFVALFRKES